FRPGGHVTVYGEVAVGLGTYVPGWGGKVQAHHGGTTGGEQPGRGQADAGGGTGDQGTYTREVGRVDTSRAPRHRLPCGAAWLRTGASRIRVLIPGSVGAR